MLKKIRSQLTDESESDDDAHATNGLVSGSSTGTDAAGTEAAEAQQTTMDAGSRAGQAPRSVELDEVFGLLKNRRRRDVLRQLAASDETMRIGELAEEIAARECEKPIGQINSQDRKRVYVGLYQCHLPKLADVGVIEYNKPRGTIDRGPTFDTITHYLPATETPPDRSAAHRPLLSALSNVVSTGRNFL